jgi:transcriptional regulator
MYQPSHFREDRIEVQHDLIRRHPLGLLISMGVDGLIANPIPFVLDVSAGALGTLQCHVARANPQWKALQDIAECLIVFQAAEHYITPSWYATKQETGKVVPTWNYATVHAWGKPQVRDDAEWVRRQIEALTHIHEGSRAAPWAVSDAPAPFVAAQLRGIVGIEIPITRLEGKWKVSQNRPEADRAGVYAGLGQEVGPNALPMADLVGAHLAPSDANRGTR